MKSTELLTIETSFLAELEFCELCLEKFWIKLLSRFSSKLFDGEEDRSSCDDEDGHTD